MHPNDRQEKEGPSREGEGVVSVATQSDKDIWPMASCSLCPVLEGKGASHSRKGHGNRKVEATISGSLHDIPRHLDFKIYQKPKTGSKWDRYTFSSVFWKGNFSGFKENWLEGGRQQ